MNISKIANEQSQLAAGNSAINQLHGKKVNTDYKADFLKGSISFEKEVKSDLSIDSNSRQVKNELNELAANIRSDRETLNKVNDFVERIKMHLDKIVKNYPPFPADSPERMEMLKSFTALRKEIERMTFPPEAKYIPELPEMTVSTTNEDLNISITALDDASKVIDEEIKNMRLKVSDIASSVHPENREDILLNMSEEVKSTLSIETVSLSGEKQVESLRQLLD